MKRNFPKTKNFNNQKLIQVTVNSKAEFKKLLLTHPNRVYVLVDEQIETFKQYTILLALYAEDMDEIVVLFDLNNQVHSTITSELEILAEGYYEFMDVGFVKRWPLQFYVAG
ncbi:hypothetical protein V8V73_00595 [Priestia megaterium]|uniref:hypothetical protein n=1 Tax=Priestia megaterium TaxID=1404 RepID=UPI003009A69C